MVNVALKHEVEQIMQRLPATATLDDLLLAMQTQVTPFDEAQAMMAQECDPTSPVRRSLQRGLQELDAGEGISDQELAHALHRE